MGFRQKIAVTFTLLIIFIMLISVYLVTIQIKHASLGRAEESGRLLGKMIALSMGEDIVRGNFQGIDYALKEFVKLNKIEYCLILDNEGKVISSTHPEIHGKYFTDGWSRAALFSTDLTIRRAASAGRPVYDTSVPIVIGGKRYGLIRAGFTIDEEFSHIRNLLFYNLSLGIILIVIGIFIAYGISSTLLSPLNAILNSIESISHGDYSSRAFIGSSDEFSELARSFNRLSSILQKKETASSYITKKILENDPELANKNFSGKLLNTVILHIELHRFNSFIEKNSPSEAVDTLNKFISQTSEIIAQADGVVDKFGEGYIVALFPISRNESWPAHLRAGFTALSVRNYINIFNFKQAQLGLEELQLKTGLTAGKVVIGHLGTRSRSDFCSIGGRLAKARKTAQLSGKSNGFMPVADRSFANMARDFLLLKPLHDDKASEDDDNECFLITGFTSFSYFRERLGSVSSRGNKSIIAAFGMTENIEGFEFLKNSVSDSSCEYRSEALKAMSSLIFQQHQPAKDFLKQFISSSEEPQLRATALALLGLSRDRSMSPLYLDLCKSADDRIRANAIEALIPLDISEKRVIFKELLNDNSPRVCANALLGLWLSDDQDTLSLLYGLLKSDDSKMRASAAFAISFLADSRKFRKLFPAYSEQSNFHILPIIENIYKRLKMMLDSIETSERFQALKAIGKIGDAETLETIVELIKIETEPEIIELGHSIIHDWEKLIKSDNAQ